MGSLNLNIQTVKFFQSQYFEHHVTVKNFRNLKLLDWVCSASKVYVSLSKPDNKEKRSEVLLALSISDMGDTQHAFFTS